MTNDQSNPNSQIPKKSYDLEERTTQFGKVILDLARQLPRNSITNPLISQIVRSGTSVGANYCEADEASSKKDFTNKISIAKKETKETRYWLKILAHAVPELSEKTQKLGREAQGLNLIFAAIIRKSKQ